MNLRSIIKVAGTHALLKSLTCKSGLAASVVLTTKNRATYVELALESLERQDIPKQFWEVVIADISSRDDTSSVLDRYETRGRLQLQIFNHTGSPVEAYRECLLKCRGSVIIFTTDERILDTNYLLRHLLRQRTKCVAISPSLATVFTHTFSPTDSLLEGVIPPKAIDLSALFEDGLLSVLSFNSPAPPSRHETSIGPQAWLSLNPGNASIPSELINLVGGLDAEIPSSRVAFSDLAYRLYRYGIPFVEEPSAIAFHQVVPRSDQPESDMDLSLHHFSCKHPELNTLALLPLLIN